MFYVIKVKKRSVMKYSDAKRYTVTRILVSYYQNSFKNVTALCKHYNVKRQAFYYWLSKYTSKKEMFKMMKRGRKTVITDRLIKFIDKCVKNNSSISIYEVTFECKQAGYCISYSTVMGYASNYVQHFTASI